MYQLDREQKPLEAIEMRFERDTGAHRIYRYRGGKGGIDVQICVPREHQETEFELRLILAGTPENAND